MVLKETKRYNSYIFYRIAYSVYEIERLLKKYTGTAVSIKVTYDIACTLEAHLKVMFCYCKFVKLDVDYHNQCDSDLVAFVLSNRNVLFPISRYS